MILINGNPTVGEISHYEIPDWVPFTSPEFGNLPWVSVRIFNQTEYRHDLENANSFHQVSIINNGEYELEYECYFTLEIHPFEDPGQVLATNDEAFSYYSPITLAGNSSAEVSTANHPYVMFSNHDEIYIYRGLLLDGREVKGKDMD